MRNLGVLLVLMVLAAITFGFLLGNAQAAKSATKTPVIACDDLRAELGLCKK